MAGSQGRKRPGGVTTAGPRRVLSVPLPAEVVDRIEAIGRPFGLRPGSVGRHLLIQALQRAEQEGFQLAAVVEAAGAA